MGKKAAVRSKDTRNKMLAALNIRWPQCRPDLRHDKQALKEGLCIFAAQANGLANVESVGDLNNQELGRTLDALPTPTVPRALATGSPFNSPVRATVPGRPRPASAQSSPVIHLASEAQKATLQKLFDFLEWNPDRVTNFISRRFKSRSLAMLKFSQATSLTRILLNIAVSKEIKRQLGDDVKVSKAMTDAAIPEIKRRLGIDQ